MARAKVIVLDAHSNSSLAVVRSLGSRGIDVHSFGESGEFNKSFYSRYAAAKGVYPSPVSSPNDFVSFISNIIRENKYEMLIPTTERTIVPISRHALAIRSYVRIAIPESEVLEQALNKGTTMKIAMREGIAVPKTTFIDNIEAVRSVAPILKYPVVLKPRWSKYWSGSGCIRSAKIAYVYSPDALFDEYLKIHQVVPFPLIQEFIPGRGLGVSVLMHKGVAKVVFAHRRIREENPTGGPSSLAESIPVTDVVSEPTLKLLRAMNWQGIAMVEFKEDERDGMPKLMEVNGRFWGSLPLAISSGIDFPYLLYQFMSTGDVSPVADYQTGVKWRYLKGDISHLIGVLKGPPRQWTGAYPSKIATIVNVLMACHRASGQRKVRYGDPLPSLLETSKLFIYDLAKAALQRVGLIPTKSS